MYWYIHVGSYAPTFRASIELVLVGIICQSPNFLCLVVPYQVRGGGGRGAAVFVQEV